MGESPRRSGGFSPGTWKFTSVPTRIGPGRIDRVESSGEGKVGKVTRRIPEKWWTTTKYRDPELRTTRETNILRRHKGS